MKKMGNLSFFEKVYAAVHRSFLPVFWWTLEANSTDVKEALQGQNPH